MTRAALRALAAALAVTMAGCAWVTDGADPGAQSETPQESASASSPTAEPAPAESSLAADADLVRHADRTFLVVTLPLSEWDVAVMWDPAEPGRMLRDVLDADPSIMVATNAGIFTPEMLPGGLLVADGEELVGLNLADGAGNFHLKPNAVFAVRDDGTAVVVDSTAYEADRVVQATQSGPALALDGNVHPEFTEGSANLALRSGVGVSPDGETVYLAMSWGLTNLWDFATLFTDELGVDDALYLDGQISDLWVSGMATPGPVAGPYAGIIVARPRE